MIFVVCHLRSSGRLRDGRLDQSRHLWRRTALSCFRAPDCHYFQTVDKGLRVLVGPLASYLIKNDFSVFSLVSAITMKRCFFMWQIIKELL